MTLYDNINLRGTIIMHNKISKIRNNMRKFDIDALLSIDMVNCYYISGFLLDKMSILITYTNVYIFVRSNRIIPENIEMPDNYHIVLFDDDFELKLLNISESRNICNIGIESNNISLKKFNTYKKKLKGITLVPTNYIIESVRFSKTDEEIDCRCSDRLTQNSSMEMTQNSPRL